MATPSLSPGQVPDLTSEYFGQRSYSLARASGSLLLGLFFFLLAWLASTHAGELVGGGILGFVTAVFMGVALGVIGARFVVRAKRYRAASAQKLLARDPRPPVLYFRPFATDATAGKTVTFSSWFTEEEELAMVMNEIGPFIAIGAPGETLPELGAARFYADNSEWQNAVQYLLPRSRLVVLRVGRTDGFWWELKNTLSHRKPQEVLLLIPRDEELYESFRRNSRDLLPGDLPRLTGWNYRKLWRGSLMAAVYFDPDGVPNIIELQTYSLPFFHRSPAYPLVPVLKTALRPLFENLGLPWKSPGISWRLIMTLAAMVLFAGALALRLEDLGGSFPQVIVTSEPHPGEQNAALSPHERRLAAVVAVEERAMERLAAIPAVHLRMEEMIKSEEFRALPREEKSARFQAFGRLHSRAGFRRLDDVALLSKLGLDRKIIAYADITDCASFARGNVSQEQLHAMLSQLEESDIERWYELVVRAVAADVAGSPAPRSYDPNRVKHTLAAIVGALPERDARNFRRILADYGHASDEETCWSERILRQGIAGLERNDQVAWALSTFQ